MRPYLLLLCAVALAGLWIGLGMPGVGTSDKDEPANDGAPQGTYLSDGVWIGEPLERVANRLNLVVIVIDTLRADVAAPGAEMPGLEKLAKRGLRVMNAASPAVWTYPSLASLLSGLHPSEHRVMQSANSIGLARSVTTFAEALAQAHGYETAALIEVDLPPHQNSMLQGFDHIRRRLPLRGAREELPRWNRKRDPLRPYFLLIHTFEAHAPYGIENHPWPERPRDPSLRPLGNADPMTMPVQDLVVALDLDWRARQFMLGGKQREEIVRRAVHYRAHGWAQQPDVEFAARLKAAYFKGARDVDGELTKTIAVLQEQGLLENALLVVTSDHGEAFGEHGVLTHGFGVHDELTRVPLVMVGPAPFQGGRRVETSMALHDLMPTFFDLAKLPPVRDRHGRSMLSALREGDAGHAVLSVEWIGPGVVGDLPGKVMYTARTSEEKYIVALDLGQGTLVEELYDLKADPGALQDLLAKTGKLGEVPVSAALAETIEEARDQLWVVIEGAGALAHMGYSAGIGTVDVERPPPPKVK